MIKDILTIVRQISLYIPKYDSDTQKVIRDFCNVFKPINILSELKKTTKRFDNQYRFSEEYYRLSFLWFACDFCRLIYRHLLLKDEPLGLIHKTLRKVHALILKSVSLSAESSKPWDDLQEFCRKELPSVLQRHYKDEQQVFYSLFSLIEYKGLGSLNPNHIHDVVKLSILGPPWKIPISKQVNIFFDLTRVEWSLLFYPSAFALSRIFVRLRITKKHEFNKFHKMLTHPKSYVYQASHTFIGLEAYQNVFIGWLILPHGFFIDFRNFLETWEEKGIFRIEEYQEVVDIKESVSYAFYQPGSGWMFPNDLSLSHPNLASTEAYKKIDNWNEVDWFFRQCENPIQPIKVLCKYWRGFFYNDLQKLAGHINRNQDNTRLFEPDTTLLWDLIRKKVLQIMIIPRELVLSFAHTYHILLPPQTVNEKEMKNFLPILPYALSIEMYNRKIGIFCYLDRSINNFIQNKLKWPVIPLRQVTAQPALNINHFNKDTYSWKIPWFLKEKNLGKLRF